MDEFFYTYRVLDPIAMTLATSVPRQYQNIRWILNKFEVSPPNFNDQQRWRMLASYTVVWELFNPAEVSYG